MKIEMIEGDADTYETEGFTPSDHIFRIFRDTETGLDVSCGNIIINSYPNVTEIYIKYIESYQKGGGSAAINYLKETYPNYQIKAEAYCDVVGFWKNRAQYLI